MPERHVDVEICADCGLLGTSVCRRVGTEK